jgi:TPR repeat protein
MEEGQTEFKLYEKVKANDKHSEDELFNEEEGSPINFSQVFKGYHGLLRKPDISEENESKNAEILLKWLEDMSDKKDNSYAKYHLAIKHLLSGEREFPYWLDLLEQSRKKGNPMAQNFLGLIYETGFYVVENENTAIKFYNEALTSGSFDAAAGNGRT